MFRHSWGTLSAERPVCRPRCPYSRSRRPRRSSGPGRPMQCLGSISSRGPWFGPFRNSVFRQGRRIASIYASNCITAKRPQFPTKTAFRGEGALVHIPADHALAALSDTKDAQFRPFLSSTHAQVRVQRRRFLVPITIPASQPGRPPTRLPGCPLLLGHPLPVIEGIIYAFRTVQQP